MIQATNKDEKFLRKRIKVFLIKTSHDKCIFLGNSIETVLFYVYDLSLKKKRIY